MSTAADPPVLQASNLYRFYRAGEEETLALQGVSLSVRAGEFVAVRGPSGSGKSTLLACLAGMDDPDGGTVRIGGQRLSHRPEAARAALRADQIGMVFQGGNLFDHLTVAQNIRLIAALAGRRCTRERLKGLLDTVGLTGRARAYPGQLSGGEAACAAVAVALTNDPILLVADEPTGELDTAAESTVLDLFGSLAAAGAAVVIASHSDAVAAAASRCLCLTDGRLI